MHAPTVDSANFWEENPNAAQDSQWTSDPHIAAAIYKRISNGQSAGHWLSWLFSDHLQGRSFERILSIGCGVGDHELALAHANPNARIDAFDFSSASIDIAKGKAREAGVETINFFVGDFNQVEFADSTYDLVLCTGSLHHVREIEHLLHQVRRTLTDTGVVIVNEYVGDCYNIYRPDQIDVLQNVLDGLPSSLKNIERFPNPTIEQVFFRDPTEAVRSKLIPDFLRIYFKNVDERHLGGALMHPLYPFLNLSELEARPDLHQAFINTLMNIDQLLLEQGKSDFSFFICANG